MEAGDEVRGETAVSPEAVVAALAQDPRAQVIDVRESYEREAGHIARSTHVPLLELAAAAGRLDRDRPVYVYCRVGSRSQMAAEALRGAGFVAYSMDGGLLRWAGEGRPLAPEGGTVADH